MKYKLTIREFVPNDKYEDEYKVFQDFRKNRFNYDAGNVVRLDQEPEKFILEKVLDVCLTDEEFKKVKSEVIKIF